MQDVDDGRMWIGIVYITLTLSAGIVYITLTLSAGGKGWTTYPIFERWVGGGGGGLDKISIFRSGCWERAGWPISGGRGRVAVFT